ncbi:MAG: NifU family protein [Actinomycetota bacterium]
MPDTSPIASAEVDAEILAAEPLAAPEDAPVDEEAEAAFHEKVAQVVKVIRPAIQADQGDIFLRDTDSASGIVTVELTGACVDCPASTQTLKQGLERILKQRIEGVTEVRHTGELNGFDEGTAVSL